MTTDLGAHERPVEVLVRPDGSTITAAALSWTPRRQAHAVALVSHVPSGETDSSFAGDGSLELVSSGERWGLAVADDGSILVADTTAGTTRLRRVLADGTLDEGFGDRGVATIAGARVRDVAVQSDGRAVVLVSAQVASALWVGRLHRFDAQGRPDVGFGEDGVVLLQPAATTLPASVDVDRDDQLVVSGTLLRPDTDFDVFVSRLAPDGAPDLGFGTAGTVLYSTPGPDFLVDVAVTASALVMVATSWDGVAGFGFGSPDVAIVRYDGQGRLDGSFGDDGVVVEDLAAVSGDGTMADDVEVGPTGIIHLAITTGQWEQPEKARPCSSARCPRGGVRAWDSSGRPLHDFGRLGVASLGMHDAWIAMAADGLMVAGTVVREDGGHDLGLVRLHP